MKYEIKTVEFTKANYVGLTIKFEQYKERQWHVEHDKQVWSKPKYRVVISHIMHDQYDDSTDHNKSRDACRIGQFKLKTEYFYSKSAIEGAALFEAVRNKVRNLGEFRNLNKGKIPDYRDEPK